MWSTCSMSTGHCSTQAPQVVHDQSTSGSITPPSSSVPTSGRAASAIALAGTPASCSAVAFSLPSASSPPPASRYGAFAAAWSRRLMISSFGDSGLPVFQAGHCDWHRPHSVQVEKSSRPFQVKFSTTPTPKTSSSAGSSKSIGLPREIIGCSGPSATSPVALRLNQMLKNAENRCQATPIVGFSAIVISQAIEITILNSATRTIAVSSVGTARPSNAVADEPGEREVHPRRVLAVGTAAARTRAPRSATMQSPTPTIVHST